MSPVYLLDSDIIIDALNGRRGRPLALQRLVGTGSVLACCAVNVAEIYAGMRPHEETRTRAFLDSLLCYPITKEVAQEAGLLRRTWAQQGTTLGLTDTMIAAVALLNGLPLITGNAKHYPMPELRLQTLAAE